MFVASHKNLIQGKEDFTDGTCMVDFFQSSFIFIVNNSIQLFPTTLSRRVGGAHEGENNNHEASINLITPN